MKNEPVRRADRIIELLAESLQQHDRQSEILIKHGNLLEKLVEGQVFLTGQVSNLQTEIKSLWGDMNKLIDYLQSKHDKLEERIYNKLLLG